MANRNVPRLTRPGPRLFMLSPSTVIYSLEGLSDALSAGEAHNVLDRSAFARVHRSGADQALCLVDSFPALAGAECCFVRLQAGTVRTVCFHLQGAYSVHSCPSGGAGEPGRSQRTHVLDPPAARAAHRRRPRAKYRRTACIVGGTGRIRRRVGGGTSGPLRLVPGLDNFALRPPSGPYTRGPVTAPEHREADLFSLGLQGQLAPARRRVSASTAWAGLYQRLHLATQVESLLGGRCLCPVPCPERPGVGLRQALLRTDKAIDPGSVMARQAADGGWYQGEWTDLMESHYRSHNSAMLKIGRAHV